jgi:hypothetical protein
MAAKGKDGGAVDEPYARIAYDMELKRPGCVLLQAMFGCFVNDENASNPANHFNSDLWIVNGISGLQVYDVPTKKMFSKIVKATEEFHQQKRKKP